jgi:ATP-binding cassette subfamily B multidrug efflux pump
MGIKDANAAGAAPVQYPIGLWDQFRKNLPLYAGGALLLIVQQSLMAYGDLRVRVATNSIVKGDRATAVTAAATFLGVSITAAIVRWGSRITMFTGGRNVEYELRAGLLARLHTLGGSFFRKMPTGEIMSRATNDLTQVRLLLGFGILNVIGSVAALASALYVMGTVSGKPHARGARDDAAPDDRDAELLDEDVPAERGRTRRRSAR